MAGEAGGGSVLSPGLFQQRTHLVVRGLRKFLVPQSDGAKRLGRRGANDVIGLLAQGGAGVWRAHWPGGRVLHHLKALAQDRRNTIVFAGFQAGGTRGARIVAGEQSIRIHGEYVAVNAEIVSLPGMSGLGYIEKLRQNQNGALP